MPLNARRQAQRYHADFLSREDFAAVVRRGGRVPLPRGFFLSGYWMDAWLATLPRATAPCLLVLSDDDGATVASAGITLRRRWRFGVLPRRIAFVNETGDPTLDRLTIEDNGLADAGGGASTDPDAYRVLVQACEHSDEVVLRNVAKGVATAIEALDGPACRIVRSGVEQRPYVDLDALRGEGSNDPCAAHLAILSRNTRQGLRRTRRLYASRGPLTLRRAHTVAEAHSFLEQLAALHQATWQGRGFSGAFASPFFLAFHRALIDRAFDAGVIDLLRIDAGDHCVGYLYNFVFGGWVHNYQSGFAYQADNRLRPGLLCHHLAIADALDRGHRVYDMLGGGARYKHSLCNASEALYSYRLLAPTSAGRAEWLIETAKRAILSRLGRTDPP